MKRLEMVCKTFRKCLESFYMRFKNVSGMFTQVWKCLRVFV
jgi:hypothetical protein